MCIPLNSCCLCVSLDVGSKIISVINLMLSVAIAMVYGTAAMLPHVAESKRIMYAIVTNVGMLQLLIGCLLVYGVFGKKPKLILPWLISSWIFCVSLLALSTFGTVLIVLQYIRDIDAKSEVSTMSAVYGSYAVILYYFASVINSRREQILYDDYTESAQGLMKFGL